MKVFIKSNCKRAKECSRTLKKEKITGQIVLKGNEREKVNTNISRSAKVICSYFLDLLGDMK